MKEKFLCNNIYFENIGTNGNPQKRQLTMHKIQVLLFQVSQSPHELQLQIQPSKGNSLAMFRLIIL